MVMLAVEIKRLYLAGFKGLRWGLWAGFACHCGSAPALSLRRAALSAGYMRRIGVYREARIVRRPAANTQR